MRKECFEDLILIGYIEAETIREKLMSLAEWMLKGQKGPVDGETLFKITKSTFVYVPGGKFHTK